MNVSNLMPFKSVQHLRQTIVICMFCGGLTLTSGTQPSPEPSQPSCTERTPEPELAPMTKNRAEQAITSEPEPHKMSD